MNYKYDITVQHIDDVDGEMPLSFTIFSTHFAGASFALKHHIQQYIKAAADDEGMDPCAADFDIVNVERSTA